MEPTCIEYFTIPLYIEVTSCGTIQDKQEMENLICLTLGGLGEINIPNAMASFNIIIPQAGESCDD
jgi:hypothetical protein